MAANSEDFSLAAQHTYYDRYMSDAVIDEYYAHSDFHNFGLWGHGADSPPDACRALVAKLVSLCPQPPVRILEVGCGKGATTQELQSHWRSAEIVAIDASENHIRIARQNCPTASFHPMDASAMTFPDRSFDLVISIEAAFHFPSRNKFFANAHRLLKPGGAILLQDVLHHKKDGSPRPAGEQNATTLDAEKIIPSQNYLAGPDAYSAQLIAAGFGGVRMIDVTAEGPQSFYQDFIKQLCDSGRWKRFDSNHVRSLRVGARLFAREIKCCLLVHAVVLPSPE